MHLTKQDILISYSCKYVYRKQRTWVRNRLQWHQKKVSKPCFIYQLWTYRDIECYMTGSI